MGDGNGRDAGGAAGGKLSGPRVGGPRAIALVGPFASGKTTLLEAILARAGAIGRQGSVAEKNTVGDASPEARAHQMSVEVNIAEADFMGDRLTFLDCPGSVEFAREAESVLPGVDLAVVVAEADAKKMPALQLILKALEDRAIPRVIFLNKMDKAEGAVEDTLRLLQQASAVPLVLRHIPTTKDGTISGFVDLALERAFAYRERAPSEIVMVPAEAKARGSEARYAMLEKLADYDDALMEQLLDDVEPARERVFADLVGEMRQALICPVLIGAGEHGNGVGRLLKFIRHEAPGIEETRRRLGLTASGEGLAQVLKTVHTGHAGKLSIVRVLGGAIGEATELSGTWGALGRPAGIMRVNGQQVSKRPAGEAGETVGLAKLDGAATGETLAVGKTPARQLVVRMAAAPVMALAIVPAERKDEVKVSTALGKAVEEDPSLQVRHGAGSGETLLLGQGEMHLRVALERLTRKYGVAVSAGEPEIAYKETIKGSVSIRGRHKKQSGGHGQFGDVVLEIKPLPRGGGFQFHETVVGGAVPRNYIPSVELGVSEYLARGPLGFAVVDIAVTLTDGSYHAVDSSDMAFRTAAQIAMREGMPQCRPVLLEPIAKVEIMVPSEATPKVNGIVSQRRGQLLGFDARPGWPGWDVVQALIPEAEIRDLIVELRSVTSGVGTFRTEFDHLAELAGKLAEAAIARTAKRAA